jgi:hypothetical protein
MMQFVRGAFALALAQRIHQIEDAVAGIAGGESHPSVIARCALT